VENLTFLLNRRSAGLIIEPGPDHAAIEQMLSVALTVPDHGRLTPYRFVVVEGPSRELFAAALLESAHAALASGQAIGEQQAAKIRQKAFAAPVLILIVASPKASEKIPEWEQLVTAGCTGYAITLSAQALGFGAVWKSFAYGSGRAVRELLRMSDRESLLGWVNVGTAGRMPETAHRQLVSDYIVYL
jgi:nitroreductase